MPDTVLSTSRPFICLMTATELLENPLILLIRNQTHREVKSYGVPKIPTGQSQSLKEGGSRSLFGLEEICRSDEVWLWATLVSFMVTQGGAQWALRTISSSTICDDENISERLEPLSRVSKTL